VTYSWGRGARVTFYFKHWFKHFKCILLGCTYYIGLVVSTVGRMADISRITCSAVLYGFNPWRQQTNWCMWHNIANCEYTPQRLRVLINRLFTSNTFEIIHTKFLSLVRTKEKFVRNTCFQHHRRQCFWITRHTGVMNALAISI